MGIQWPAVIIVALDILIVVVMHKRRWFRAPKREPLFPTFDAWREEQRHPLQDALAEIRSLPETAERKMIA